MTANNKGTKILKASPDSSKCRFDNPYDGFCKRKWFRLLDWQIPVIGLGKKCIFFLLPKHKQSTSNPVRSRHMALLITFLFSVLPLISAEAIESDHTLRSNPGFDSPYSRRVVTTGYFKGSDGKPVRYRKYEHLGHDKATVVFLNGRAEFIEKYDVLFSTLHEYPVGPAPADETLTDLPVSFITLDHEGQGKSQQQEERLGGHIDDFNNYVKDVELLFKEIPVLRHHLRPTFMMSHSMGGLIAAQFVQKYPRMVDGMIFSSPMFGFASAEGITPEQLEQIVGFYAVKLNMPKLCSNPDPVIVEPTTLAAIAIVNSDKTLKPCFDDPSGANCGLYTQCLLIGQENNCKIEGQPLPPINFAGLNFALQYLRSLPEGCPARTYAWDPELSTDVEYGTWSQTHPLHGREPTFGWFNQSFMAQHAFFADKKINLPTLMLVDRHDLVIDAKKAIKELDVGGNKVICNSKFNPVHCRVHLFDDYRHELFGTGGRAAVLAEVRNFLEDHLPHHGMH